MTDFDWEGFWTEYAGVVERRQQDALLRRDVDDAIDDFKELVRGEAADVDRFCQTVHEIVERCRRRAAVIAADLDD